MRQLRRPSALIFIVTVSLFASCGLMPPLAKTGAQEPLIFDTSDSPGSEKIVIFIPGALSSMAVFAATDNWKEAGYIRAYYRYPGLDGMAVDHHVDPSTAARHVAAFANAYPEKDVTLVGYSTGGLIALEAAPQIDRSKRTVKVAGMSPAVEFGGGVPTLLRGARDVISAAAATGSLSKAALWKRYWAGLLFGPAALDDPALAEPLAEKIAQGEQIYVKLDLRMALAHMVALPTWQLPVDLDLSDIPVAFFVGLSDPVFSTEQTQRFAAKLGDVSIYGYPGQGHLLFFTRPGVFADMLDFAEGRDPLAR